MQFMVKTPVSRKPPVRVKDVRIAAICAMCDRSDAMTSSGCERCRPGLIPGGWTNSSVEIRGFAFIVSLVNLCVWLSLAVSSLLVGIPLASGGSLFVIFLSLFVVSFYAYMLVEEYRSPK